MSESRKVVRREPEVFEAVREMKIGPLELWRVRNEMYNSESFPKTFIDAEVATDLAWNAVIEKLIEDAEKKHAEVRMMFTAYHFRQLRKHLRPISATEGGADE